MVVNVFYISFFGWHAARNALLEERERNDGGECLAPGAPCCDGSCLALHFHGGVRVLHRSHLEVRTASSRNSDSKVFPSRL